MARDPGDLYQVSPDAPELDADLVMLYYLDGFIDAGAAGRLLTTHLLTTLEHTEIARFDVDSLIDYRSRRPVDDLRQGPLGGLRRARDHGARCCATRTRRRSCCSTAWSRTATGRRSPGPCSTCRPALNVRLVVSFHGIPMGVPHTRPLGITAHATQPELIDGYQPLVDRLQVPGSASALIEFRMGEDGQGGRRVRRARAALPGARRLPGRGDHAARAVERATGLNLPGEALREAAQLTDAEIARQVEGSEEVTEVVRSLEQQYDAFTADRQDLLAGRGRSNMPTAEELGAQFERFLAEQQYGGEGTPES